MKRVFSSALAIGLLSICGCTEPVGIEPPIAIAEDATFESEYFAVSVSGTGPNIILVPGLASSGAVWDGTVASLQDRFTLHVVQVSGFAGSPAAGNRDNENILDDLASDLSAYANRLDAPPVLIGHSLGGLVAMKTALLPDAAFSQLVIVDVLPFFSVLMDPDATSESIAPVSAIMKATLLGQSDDVFAMSQAEALSALVKSEDDLKRALEWSVTSDRAVMAQAMSEVLVTDLRSEISTLGMPTSIIYARDSSIPNMAGIEAFYQDLYAPVPEYELIAIEDALHFVMLDQPDAFQAALEAIISQ